MIFAKNKKNKKIFTLVTALLFLSIFFFNTLTSYAAEVTTEQQKALDEAASKQNTFGPGLPVLDPSNPSVPQGIDTRLLTPTPKKIDPNTVPSSQGYFSKCGITDLGCIFNGILYGILTFFGWLLSLAASLFAWVVDPSIMSGPTGLLNKPAVRDIWIMVRDLLNLLFIFVLLLSAFSTIFQVGKYHISKVWLSVLLNALLVNFSFPIARLIIDLSNVIMYYFLNNLFQGVAAKSGAMIFANIANETALAGILKPDDYASAPVAFLIASIVFTFILAVTLLVLAALFVVRLVTLTMLVMFSPIGFTGYIFPGTAGYAKKWWGKLMDYAFFGPIMTFGIAVALKIMETLKNDNMNQMIMQAGNNSIPEMKQWLGEASFFILPIMILWMTMGYAKGAGIAGAGMVIGRAEKFSKWAKGLPMRGIKGTGKFAYKAAGGHGINAAVKDKWSDWKKSGPLGSNAIEARTARVAQGLGVDGAVHDNVNKRAGEFAKEAGLDNLSVGTLQGMLAGANEPKRVAILEELAKKGAIDGADLKSVIDKYKADSQIGARFLNKVKETRPDLAYNHLNLDDSVKDPTTGLTAFEQKMQDHVKSDKFDIKKINAEALNNEKLVAAMVGAGIMDDKKIKDLIGRGTDFENNYKNTLTKVIDKKDAAGNYTHADITQDSNKNMQMQHLALKGGVHFSIAGNNIDDKDKRAQLFKKLDKNSAKNLSFTSLANYAGEIADNLKRGKEGDILSEMKDDKLRDEIISRLKAKRGTDQYIDNLFDADPFLKRYKEK